MHRPIPCSANSSQICACLLTLGMKWTSTCCEKLQRSTLAQDVMEEKENVSGSCAGFGATFDEVDPRLRREMVARPPGRGCLDV